MSAQWSSQGVKRVSKVICIMGESGSGKTTAMRTLDPQTTYYIDCDGKGLAWKGWKTAYNAEHKNYKKVRDIQQIQGILSGISDKAPQVKTVVIDTLNTCMLDHEIKEMKNGGYGKWVDLTVLIVMHSETIRDDFGYSFTRIKTNGRKLEKVVLESLFGTVLLAKRTEDGRYVFETQAKNSTAKSPMGAFETFEIDNDMAKVLKALDEF